MSPCSAQRTSVCSCMFRRAAASALVSMPGCCLLDDERCDRLVDRASRNRLAIRRGAAAMGAVADIPCLQPSTSGGISDAYVLTALATHRAALQQRCTFSRWRGARELVLPTVCLKELEVLLESIPGDVARVSVRDTCEPLVAVAGLLHLHAVGSAVVCSAIELMARLAHPSA